MLSDIKISALSREHVPEVSKIHQTELEVGVLNLFGQAFLETMYRELLDKNWGFVAHENQELVGFICATEVEISLLRCLSLRSIFVFLLNSIKNPRKLRSFIAIFQKLYLNRYDVSVKSNHTAIELSQFAVKEHWKGRGIGRKLIEALEEKGRMRGATTVFTRTHNPALAEFYYGTRNATVVEHVSLGSMMRYCYDGRYTE